MNVVLAFMIKNKLDILSENLIFMAYFLLLINKNVYVEFVCTKLYWLHIVRIFKIDCAYSKYEYEI